MHVSFVQDFCHCYFLLFVVAYGHVNFAWELNYYFHYIFLWLFKVTLFLHGNHYYFHFIFAWYFKHYSSYFISFEWCFYHCYFQFKTTLFCMGILPSHNARKCFLDTMHFLFNTHHFIVLNL